MPELVTEGLSDAEFARDLKERLRVKLVEATEIMNEAQHRKMRVQFAIAPDGFGRQVIQSLDIVRVIA